MSTSVMDNRLLQPSSQQVPARTLPTYNTSNNVASNSNSNSVDTISNNNSIDNSSNISSNNNNSSDNHVSNSSSYNNNSSIDNSCNKNTSNTNSSSKTSTTNNNTCNSSTSSIKDIGDISSSSTSSCSSDMSSRNARGTNTAEDTNSDNEQQLSNDLQTDDVQTDPQDPSSVSHPRMFYIEGDDDDVGTANRTCSDNVNQNNSCGHSGNPNDNCTRGPSSQSPSDHNTGGPSNQNNVMDSTSTSTTGVEARRTHPVPIPSDQTPVESSNLNTRESSNANKIIADSATVSATETEIGIPSPQPIPSDQTPGVSSNSTPPGLGLTTASPIETEVYGSFQVPVFSDQTPGGSGLRAVCRQCSVQVVVRCQVRSHGVMHTSASCPAVFSPRWTQVVRPVVPRSPAKTASRKSERKRRHTVGPAAHAHLSQQHHHQGLQQVDTSQPDCVVRGRSHSDSELIARLREMGKELRRISDDFNFSKTGVRLKPVTETIVSDEDSDDEM